MLRGGNEAALDICRVIFHLDYLTLPHAIPRDDVVDTDPLFGAGTAPVSQALTNTTNPKSTTPTAIGSRNRVSNFT